jgi:hypothetical protein
MQHNAMEEFRKKLGEFFYPFLGNVELGNISASENINNLIDAFIIFNERGYFRAPNSDCDAVKHGQMIPQKGKPEAASGGLTEKQASGDKKSVLYPNLTDSEVSTLMWTISCMVSEEVRALRSEVYRLLLASQK